MTADAWTGRVIAERRRLAVVDGAGEAEAIAPIEGLPLDQLAAAWELEAKRPLPRSNAIDAADLLALDLPPLRWIVPDFLPEGTTILAAPPKIGKSCLVYQLVVEVALGGTLLGRRVASGTSLYLALEDGQRRGRDRLRAALGNRTMPRGRLEVRWSAPAIGQGLEQTIAAWLDDHPDAAVVAIDTLGKLRPRTDGRRNAYQVDVEDLGRLQGLFRDRQVALVIVHHARKELGDDFLASVSGTYGVTGSADSVIVVKRKRLEEFGTLVVTGRDIAEAEIPARFDGALWQAAPASLPEASFERTEVFRVIETSGPIFPKAIADRLGLGRTSVQQMVGKLVERGAVVRTNSGYVAPKDRLSTPNHSDNSESEWSNRGHAREADGPTDDLGPPPCPDPETYSAHRNHHYRLANGWGCRACEAAASPNVWADEKGIH